MNEELIYRAHLRAMQEMREQAGLARARAVTVIFVILAVASIVTAIVLPRYLQQRAQTQMLEQLERDAFRYRR